MWLELVSPCRCQLWTKWQDYQDNPAVLWETYFQIWALSTQRQRLDKMGHCRYITLGIERTVELIVEEPQSSNQLLHSFSESLATFRFQEDCFSMDDSPLLSENGIWLNVLSHCQTQLQKLLENSQCLNVLALVVKCVLTQNIFFPFIHPVQIYPLVSSEFYACFSICGRRFTHFIHIL